MGRYVVVVSLQHLGFEAEFLSEIDLLWPLSKLRSDPVLVGE